MTGYDLYVAMNGVEERYIEEAGHWSGIGRKRGGWVRVFRTLAACLALLLLPISALAATGAFSALSGDELAFENVTYLGDGIVELEVRNDSDKTLCFEETVKLCKFYANEELAQIPGGTVAMEGNTVEPHSTSNMRIDLSKAYDMTIVEQPLENDWYYLILTNDSFLFGQDWHCSVDFARTDADEAQTDQGAEIAEPAQEKEPAVREVMDNSRFAEDWGSPLETLEISTYYGDQPNGSFSDRIHFAGTEGEAVYAVADGVVTETGFDRRLGNFITLRTESGSEVQYGSLQEIKVTAGQEITRGETIGTLGATGMATGANLSLALIVDGETIDPLSEISAP